MATTATINIKALFDTSEVASGAKQIQNIFKNIKVSNTLQSDFTKAFSNLENAVGKVQQKYEQGFKTKGDISSFERSFKEAENAALQYEKVIEKIQAEVGDSIDLSKLIKWDDTTINKLKEVETEIQRVKSKLQFNTSDSGLTKIEAALSKITSTAPKTTELINNFKEALVSGDLTAAEESLTKLENIWSRFKDSATHNAIFDTTNGLRQAFEELKKSGVFAELEKLYNQKGTIQTEAWAKFSSILSKAGIDLSNFNGNLGQTKNGILGAANAQQQWNSSVDQFKSRIQYFFGLNNIIQLVRRSLREAYNTVKELDAAMAKTAVVTDFTIADMWNQLPKYTNLANELGVTTKGAYETMTLFYQQGLDTNEAFALGTETMKMARIAGLDYATATDYMTAALRGFNMELNEFSAQKVNDVYSRLAAITASNTEEISTAMTKVASLAHNANMEFETTSAFLAQMIETTRESAETAGTALKTVVARFSEVKKLYSKEQLTGTDEEGQAIDVNRIGIALRTAGIDLNKYFLGEVGLDDIFVELASKWDSLTSVQQRYIATQAAGSRQQSRFIAMMSNYARTQELISEAYNSTGASEKQFEKTQESLETAINRLTNAWNQFTMNLANNDAIKGVITGLTKVLELLNSITGVFGSGWRTLLTGGLGAALLFGGGKLTNAAFSASKIAGANADITWGQAFKTQLGSNPYTVNRATGEITGRGSRSRLFGSNGFFGPSDEEIWNNKQHYVPDYLKKDYIKYQKQQQGITQRRWGGGIAAAGLALSAGGSIITQNAESIADALDKSQTSVENFGKGMSTLGTTASMVGSMLMLIPGPIGVVAAAITGLVGVLIAFRGETEAETFKRLSDNVKEAEDAAQSASDAYDNLLTKSASHNELLDQISKLKEGTLEFRKALMDANEEALDLIETYNLSSNDYYTTDQGLIMFNPGVMQEMQEQQLEFRRQAQQRTSVAKLSQQAYNDWRDLPTRQKAREQGDINALGAGGPAEMEKYIPDDFNLLEGQQALRSALTSIVGTKVSGATELAIEDLVANYNPKDYEYQRRAAELEVDEMKNADVRNEYRSLIGEIPKNLNIDDIRDAVVDAKIANQLSNDLNDKILKVDQNASKEAKNFNKTSLKVLLEQAKTSNDTYSEIAANAALQKVATTQGQIAEYTDLPINLRFGDYTTEQIQQIGSMAKTFGTTFGSQSATEVVTAINNEIVRSGKSPLLESLSKINFTGAAATDLRKIQALGENYAEIFTAAFKDVGEEKGLFESFYYGQTEVIDNLTKMADAAGNISGENILDAADDCEELADLLEVGEINAAGLAQALTLINTDQLTTDNLTSALIKSLSKAEELNQVLAQTDKFLSEWNEAPSGDRFAKWASGGAESILDAWGAGRYQDDQARQYLQEMLGTDFMRDYNKIMAEAGNIAEKQGGQKAADYIESQLGNELKLFQDLSKSDNLKPLYDYFGAQNQKAFKDNGISFEDGMVHFATGIHTAEEAVAALQKSGISETMANLMVSDYLQYSPDARLDWGAAAAQQGIDEFQKTLDSGQTVLKSELEQYDKLYGDLLPENWIDDFEQQNQGKVIDLAIDWTSSTDPINTLEKAFEKQGGLEKYLKSKNALNIEPRMKGGQYSTQTVADLDNMVQAYKDLGATEAQALDLSQKYVDSIKEQTGQQIEFQASYEKWSQDQEGNWIQTTDQVTGYTNAVEAANAAQEAAAKSRQDMENTILKSNISEGITEAIKSLADESVEIGITYNPAEYKSNVPPEESVTVTYDVGPYNSKVNHNEYVTVHYQDESGNPISSPAAGGLVKSFASGSANRTISPGLALTGEEGPEFVWNKDKGYAYLTGVSHPELRDLKPGDRIFDANETKKILHGAAAGGRIPSLATSGYIPGIGSDDSSKKKGGGGGSGSSKEKDKDNEWKNEIDWLYNVVQNIEELERQQNILQEKYNDLLTDQTKTGQDLYKMLIQQLGNLYAQLDHQTYALEKREQEMREFMDITNDKDEYLWYNWNDRTIEIDWDKIDQITDEEEYNHIKELIDQAEDIQDKMDDAEDAIIDINNSIQDLENIWRDTFVDFEDRVLKAVIKMYQTVIDNYSELNDTLNDSNSAILDAINKEISLQRQIRDNTKTEEEIANDEAQLAYLRRDTTGGNDLAALQLEKELNDQRQNYEDNLIDQAVQRLQDDNDAAAQQREKQIEIMQAQLDYQSENGEFNQYIRDLMDTAIDGDGHLATDSDLYKLLAEQENADAMTKVGREVWEEELNGTFKEVMAFLLKEQGEAEGTYFTAVTAAFQGVQDQFDKFYHGSYSQGSIHVGSGSSSGGGSSTSTPTKKDNKGDDEKPVTTKVDLSPKSNTTVMPSTGSSVLNTTVKNTVNLLGGASLPSVFNNSAVNKAAEEAIKKKGSVTVTKKTSSKASRAEGGTVDSTGWGLLHGTIGAPEYVLNAKQTDAFLRLADVLPAAMNNTGSSVSNTFGATTNNIVINVDKIDSDYSVDQMVARVKESLFESGSYRNNNVLNFLR